MKKSCLLSLFILVFSLMLSACNTADLEPTTTPIPSGTASPVPTQAEMLIETPMPTPVPLSDEGPWLVFTDDAMENAKIFGVNADGTGKILLLEGRFLNQVAGSPTGDLLAAIVYSDEKLSPKLLLIKLPEGEIVREVFLLSFYEDQPESFDDGPTGPGGGIYGDFQWSPDGRYLAFMGAIEGPNSSLYIYDSNEDVIKRLSENEYQAVAPVWSPDGQRIIFQDVINFHGLSISGMWIASIEDAESELIYDSTECYAEQIMGWVGNDSFVVEHGGGISRKEICFVDLETGNVQVLFPDPFLFGVVDKKSGAVAVFPHTNVPNSTFDLEMGIYLVSPEITTPKLIRSTDQFSRFSWYEEKGLFISNIECETDPTQAMVFNSSGEKICVTKQKDSYSYISPDEQYYLDRDSEWIIYKANGDKLGAVSEIIDGLGWSLDSKGFFINSDETIFYISVPEMVLYEVHQSQKGYYDFTWVGAPQD